LLLGENPVFRVELKRLSEFPAKSYEKVSAVAAFPIIEGKIIRRAETFLLELIEELDHHRAG
jgi:hypothetical protein